MPRDNLNDLGHAGPVAGGSGFRDLPDENVAEHLSGPVGVFRFQGHDALALVLFDEVDAADVLINFPMEKFNEVNFVETPALEFLFASVRTIAKELLLGIPNSLSGKRKR